MTPQGQRDEGRELMLRVKQGDEIAFENLVVLYRDTVFATIFRYIGDAARAEDLAQEVFLRVYRARRSYRPLARFKTWLFRILFNLVVNEAEARKRRPAISLEGLRGDGSGELFIADEGTPSPEEELERDEMRRKVREAVLSLPENQKLALVLSRFEELSYGEIAETMDLSIEAVKSILFRAREKVRNKLARYMKVETPDEL
jgi:RNA polymerase sigma-70 factor (ECF subfamily)